jgi:hypothetical protein
MSSVEPLELPDEEPGHELLPDTDDEAILVGPGGIDDPETIWKVAEPTEPLPTLTPGEFLLLPSGAEPWVADDLPSVKHFKFGIAISQGELVVCTGKRRSWSRTPLGHSADHADAPLAERLIVIFIRHRANGNRTRPRKYIAIAGSADTLLGWLDYSDSWNFDARILGESVNSVGIEYEVERYEIEPEFELAHPGWIG